MKEDYQKAFKKGNFIFSFKPSLFQQTKLSETKEDWAGTSDQSLFRLQNKFRKIISLVMYYLTMFDDVL